MPELFISQTKYLGVDGFFLRNNRGMAKFVEALIKPVGDAAILLVPQVGNDIRSKINQINPYWEQVTLPKLARKKNCRTLLCGFNTAPLCFRRDIQLVQVVHDTIFMSSMRQLPLSSSANQNLGRLYRRLIVPRTLKQANYIVTVSYFARNQIAETFHIPRDNIHVIPNSISRDTIVTSPLSYRSRPQRILTVSGESPHKNLMGAFKILQLLVGKPGLENLQLMVAGVSSKAQKGFTSATLKMGLGNNVHLLPHLSEDELTKIYRTSLAYLCTSLQEGFGIPVLEAMAAGTPVISSNRTSLPEVIGDAGILFDPHDEQAGAEAIHSVINDEHLFDTMAARGLSRSKHYTRDVIDKLILDFWAKVGVLPS